MNGVNVYEPVLAIYILPIWVRLPRPADDLNALPLCMYEFREIWFRKAILKRVFVIFAIFPRLLHFSFDLDKSRYTVGVQKCID